jgi:hypothetical protein
MMKDILQLSSWDSHRCRREPKLKMKDDSQEFKFKFFVELTYVRSVRLLLASQYVVQFSQHLNIFVSASQRVIYLWRLINVLVSTCTQPNVQTRYTKNRKWDLEIAWRKGRDKDKKSLLEM